MIRQYWSRLADCYVTVERRAEARNEVPLVSYGYMEFKKAVEATYHHKRLRIDDKIEVFEGVCTLIVPSLDSSLGSHVISVLGDDGRRKEFYVDRCDIEIIDGFAEVPVPPPKPVERHKIWAVHYEDKWCRVDAHEKPAPGTPSVDTLCGMVVRAPLQIQRCRPTCEACLFIAKRRAQ